MCEGREDCESEANIREWLKNKYVVLLMNQIRFSSDDFFHNAAIKESKIEYLLVNTQIRQTLPYKIDSTELELQDFDVIMLDKHTRIEMTELFRVTKQAVISYERTDNTWFSISFERNLNLMTYQRTVYTLFELLSDIGGFSGLLYSICAMITFAWNFNSFENFMVQRLFKLKKPAAELAKMSALDQAETNCA